MPLQPVQAVGDLRLELSDAAACEEAGAGPFQRGGSMWNIYNTSYFHIYIYISTGLRAASYTEQMGSLVPRPGNQQNQIKLLKLGGVVPREYSRPLDLANPRCLFQNLEMPSNDLSQFQTHVFMCLSIREHMSVRRNQSPVRPQTKPICGK